MASNVDKIMARAGAAKAASAIPVSGSKAVNDIMSRAKTQPKATDNVSAIMSRAAAKPVEPKATNNVSAIMSRAAAKPVEPEWQAAMFGGTPRWILTDERYRGIIDVDEMTGQQSLNANAAQTARDQFLNYNNLMTGTADEAQRNQYRESRDWYGSILDELGVQDKDVLNVQLDERRNALNTAQAEYDNVMRQYGIDQSGASDDILNAARAKLSQAEMDYNKVLGQDRERAIGEFTGGLQTDISNVAELLKIADTTRRESDLSKKELLEQRRGVNAQLDQIRASLRAEGKTEDEIESLFNYYRQMNSAEERKTAEEEARAAAENRSDFGNWFANTALGITSGVGAVDIGVQKIVNDIRGKDAITGQDRVVDYNSAWQSPYYISEAIMQGEMDKITKENGGTEWADSRAGFIRANGYQLAVSMGQSAAVAGLSAMGVPAATLLLGGSAATSTMQEFHDLGYSDGQAIAMGVAAGFAEYITEKYSLESLMSMRSVNGLKGKEAVKVVLGNIFRQTVTEGSEEMASDFVNLAADCLINGDMSKNKMRIQELVAQGVDPEEARKQVEREWLSQLMQDGIMGAISGGLFGGGGMAINAAATNAGYNAAGKTIITEQTQKTLQNKIAGLDDTIVKAVRADAEIDTESRKSLGRAADALGRSEMAAAVQEQLQAAGEEASPELISGILAMARNERLLAAEKNAVRQSENAKAIAEQLGEAMQEKFNANNAWAQRPVYAAMMASSGMMDGIPAPEVDLGPSLNYDGIPAPRVALAGEEIGPDTRPLTMNNAPAGAEAMNEGGNINGRNQMGNDSAERMDLQRAGGESSESAGGMAEAAGADQRGKAEERRVRAVDLPEQGSRDLIEIGTDSPKIKVLPETMWDDELREAYAQAEAKGLEMVPVVGELEGYDHGTIVTGNAVIVGNRIIVQADNADWGVMQLIEHEIGHSEENEELNAQTRAEILDRYSEEEFTEIFNTYKAMLPGYTQEEILSEIIQNARAGMNAFGKDVTQYRETVRETYDRALSQSGQEQKNGTRETRGPTEWSRTTEEDTEHTPEQKRVIKEFDESVDRGAVDFANRVKTLENKKYRNKVRYSLSDVSERQAEVIQNLTGIDAAEFENIITGGAIDHIENRHGANGKADRSMADSKNIGRIWYILKNFDSAELLLNDDGTPSVSDVWKDSDGKPAKRIVFSKRIDGTFFVAVATPDSNAKVIAVESAFIGKTNGSTGTVLNMDNSPQVTPEAPQRANASIDMVSQETGESKGNLQEKPATWSRGGESDTVQGISVQEKTEIRNALQDIIGKMGGKVRAHELETEVQRLYKAITTGDETMPIRSAEDMKRYAKDITRKIAESAGEVTEVEDTETLREIKNSLRQKISITEKESHDIPDFNKWRRSYFGKLNITFDQNVQGVDQAYSELAAMYPGYFPEGITNRVDMLMQMAEVADRKLTMDTEINEDEVTMAAEELLSKLMQIRKEDNNFSGWEFNNGFESGEVRLNRQAEKLQIVFEEKPGEDVQDQLRANGFAWVPKEQAWERKLTEKAITAAWDLGFGEQETGLDASKEARNIMGRIDSRAYDIADRETVLAKLQTDDTVNITADGAEGKIEIRQLPNGKYVYRVNIPGKLGAALRVSEATETREEAAGKALAEIEGKIPSAAAQTEVQTEEAPTGLDYTPVTIGVPSEEAAPSRQTGVNGVTVQTTADKANGDTINYFTATDEAGNKMTLTYNSGSKTMSERATESRARKVMETLTAHAKAKAAMYETADALAESGTEERVDVEDLLPEERPDKLTAKLFGIDIEKEQEAEVKSKAIEDMAKILEEYPTPFDMYAEQSPIKKDPGAPTEPTDGKVQTKVEQEKKTLGQKLRDFWRGFRREMVNAGEAVHRAIKVNGDTSLDGYYFNAMASRSRAGNWVTNQRMSYDLQQSGKGLNEILDPIRKKGEEYYEAFQIYLLHQLNVERMSRDRGLDLEEKQRAVEEFVAGNPDIAAMSRDDLRYHAGIVLEPGEEDYNNKKRRREAANEYLELIAARDEAERSQNKPVFGYEVTAGMSMEKARMAEIDHPEFKEMAEEVYAYSKDLLQYRVDAGLISQEDMYKLNAQYPHYIPVFYDSEGLEQKIHSGGVTVSTAIKRARGGDGKILPLHTALARQTSTVMHNVGMNDFGKRLMFNVEQNREGMKPFVTNIEETPVRWETDFARNDDVLMTHENVISIIQDGKRYDLTLTKEMAAAFQMMKPGQENNAAIEAIGKATNLFKALCTSYAPTFMLTNPIRDVQDVLFYSKDLKGWVDNYPQAWKEIVKSGKYWQMYKAVGGVYGSYFDWLTGESTEGKSKVLNWVEKLNMWAEQAPRLAEFMATVKKAEVDGKVSQEVLMEAFHNAQEITTNFGQSGGKTAKTLNKVVPFWNAGVQGADKFFRTMTEKKNFAAWGSLVLKAAAFGMLPEILNGLRYRDDDEWDIIDDEMKVNYYLLKGRDGQWIKIPKGRVLATLSTPVVGAMEGMRGDKVDWGDLGKAALGNIAPNNPLETNIFSTAMQARLFDKDDPGKNWYGGDIESKRLQNYAPGERYDESTDYISKWIGGKLNLSPKKINYIIDQYSGVIGDLVLPYLTPKAEKGWYIFGGKLLLPYSSAAFGRFTTDTVRSNDISDGYYDLLDQLGYAAKAGDDNAKIAEKFMNAAGSEISDLYAQIREIENDTELTGREKTELTRELRKQLNKLQKDITEEAERYLDAAGDFLRDERPDLDYTDEATVRAWMEKYNAEQTAPTAKLTEEQAQKKMEAEVYRELNRQQFGAEYALEKYNGDVYEKAQELNEESGIDYEAFYDYYFGKSALRDDKDAQGRTISGTKMEKVVELIDGLDIPDEQKDALYYDAGYSDSKIYNTPWHGGDGSFAKANKEWEIAEDEEKRDAWVQSYLTSRPEIDYTDTATVRAWMEQYNAEQSSEEYWTDLAGAASKMRAEVEREANKAMYGADYALHRYSEDVWEKAQGLNVNYQLAYEDYYDFYFQSLKCYSDKDENGKSISGSKKAKIVDLIDSMAVTDDQKDGLFLAAGYTESGLKGTPWHGGKSGSGGGGGGRRGGSRSRSSGKRSGKAVTDSIRTTAAGKTGGDGWGLTEDGRIWIEPPQIGDFDMSAMQKAQEIVDKYEDDDIWAALWSHYAKPTTETGFRL